MVTRSQSIQNFNDKTSDLINSKFIVAEKKVAEVLISISDSVLLFELFKHASEGFDYKTVKSVCFARDAQGVGYFKLPKTDGDVLALGLAILSEIDNGEVDIIDLCTEYFPSKDGKQRSYALFATQLLIPFQQTALRLAKAIIENEDKVEVEEIKPEIIEEKVEKTQAKVEEKTSVAPLNFGYVTELKKQALIVAEKLKKGREPYDELYFVLEELELYLAGKSLRGITLAFTAIKHIKQSVKKLNVDLDEIAKIVSGAVV